MKIKYTSTLLSAALGLALLSAPAHGAFIVTPTSATATSEIDTGRTIDKTIDGSALFNDVDKTAFTGTLTTTNITDVVSGASTNPFDNTYWLSDIDRNANDTVTFKFDGAYDLTSIYLWNYRRNTTGDAHKRGLKNFDVAFSNDGGTTFTTAVSATTLGILDFDAPPATGGAGDTAYVDVQQRDFTSTQSGVTDIRFSSMTSHNGATSYLGFNEITFAAVPEPSAVALIGLAGLALFFRRRR